MVKSGFSRVGGELSTLLGAFLDLAVPSFCQACHLRLSGDRVVAFCRACWGKIDLIAEPCCFRCGAPVEPEAFPRGGPESCRECSDQGEGALARVLSAGLYQGVMKDAIHAYKLSGLEALAGPLGAMAAAAARTATRPLQAQALLPVPASPHRIRERGFDPTLLLARKIGMALDLTVLERVLTRPRGSVPQSRLGRKARLENPQGRFQVRDSEILTGLNLLVVDDIMTTGATLRECARVLKEAGVSRVEALTVARGLQKR